MNQAFHRVVGIDLGTTYSVVAAHNAEKDEAVALAEPQVQEGTIIPSVVSPVIPRAIISAFRVSGLPIVRLVPTFVLFPPPPVPLKVIMAYTIITPLAPSPIMIPIVIPPI